MREHINHGELPDTEALRVLIEAEQATSMWGTPYRITPRLVERVFGDGRKLMWIHAISTRPNYYVVRVDSSWNTSNFDESPNFGEYADDVVDAICAEYGSESDEWVEDLPEEEQYFPIWIDGGCGWGEEPWPDVACRVAA